MMLENNLLTKDEITKEIIISKKTQQEHQDWNPAQCLTSKLTDFFNLLVDSCANKNSWENYSWLEEMKSETCMILFGNALKYDETRFDNPVGYYTQLVKFCFVTFSDRR